jgi:transmembrane sensor
MTQQEFEKLSEKFQQGACNSEELSRLELWLAEEEKLTDNNSFFANETEEENTRQRIWLGLKEAIFPNNIKGVFQKSWLPSLYRVAGVIIAVVAVWWFSIEKTPSELNESIVGVESKNAGNSEQMIMLPDSSTVFLDVGASLVVDENFGKKNRVVQLTGGAYFEIKKNIQQPFLVYADGLITEVLGTSFHIKPEERNKKIEVSVVTGKVSVYTKGDGAKLKRDGVIVSTNQKIVYDKELKTIRQDLIDFPKILRKERW